MKKSLNILITTSLISGSFLFGFGNDIATDSWGKPLKDNFGNQVFVDQFNGKPVDKYGFDVKGNELNDNYGLKYDNNKDIYDSRGFKGNRWGD